VVNDQRATPSIDFHRQLARKGLTVYQCLPLQYNLHRFAEGQKDLSDVIDGKLSKALTWLVKLMFAVARLLGALIPYFARN
jgi:hypothetical protein